MRAVRVTGYHEPLQLQDVPKPEVTGPHDVIVRIGGAGVCRTDLHILEGQWRRPDAQQHRFDELSLWTDLAKQLEAARFDAMFL